MTTPYCEYCQNPGQFGLLPAVTVQVEKWGRFGPVLENELGEPMVDWVSKEPVRGWASKTVPILMHPNIHQTSSGPMGIICKKSAN